MYDEFFMAKALKKHKKCHHPNGICLTDMM